MQNYETTEHRIKREFEAYGPIKRVSIRSFLLGSQASPDLVRISFFSISSEKEFLHILTVSNLYDDLRSPNLYDLRQ